jgi:biopolymer transport protein ExbB/TolQ
MRYVRRVVYPVLFVIASLMLALFYPMLLLVFYAGAFVLLMLSRQLNFYRMVMVLKQAVRNLGAKLRYEIRIRLHLGFRDQSNASVDYEDDLHRRTHRYVR